MKRILLFLLLLSACVTKPPQLPEGPRDLLFPHGTYQHLVKVKLTKAPPKGPQEFEFRGVFVSEQNRLKLVALSPVGTTLFRVEEDLVTHQIKIQTYMEALKKAEDKIMQSYTVTKKILTLPASKEWPSEMDFDTPEGKTHLVIDAYDSNKVPSHIKVTNPQYNLEIAVVSYEF
jgi:hypothetical protein